MQWLSNVDVCSTSDVTIKKFLQQWFVYVFWKALQVFVECNYIFWTWYEKNALGEYEKNNAPGEGATNNRSKESDETVKATLVLQVLSILDKEIVGTLEDPEFISKLFKAKLQYWILLVGMNMATHFLFWEAEI